MSGITFVVDGARCGVAFAHAQELAERLRDLRGGAESPGFAAAALIDSCVGRGFDLLWTEHELTEIRAALSAWSDPPADVLALRDALDGRLAA
jgi:hypothetical protein